MTPEQLVAILTAVTALVTTLGAIVLQLAKLRYQLQRNHDAINGRVGELLVATQLAALKEGELRGRDARRPSAADRPAGMPQNDPQTQI